MPDDANQKSDTLPKKRRRLRRTLIACLLVFLPVVAILGFLPVIISQPMVREKIEILASEQLKRPVRLKLLRWRRSEGVLLGGLMVEDDSSFSSAPLLSLDRLKIDVGFLSLFNGRLFLNAEMDGLKANVIRDETGESNIQRLLDGLTKPSEVPAPQDSEKSIEVEGLISEKSGRELERTDDGKSALKLPEIKIDLPLDLGALVRFNGFALSVEDRSGGGNLRMSNLSFLLEAPSLLQSPVSLELHSEIELNEKKLDPISVKLNVSNFIDSEKRINIANLNASLNARAPGLAASVSTELAEKALKSSVEIDLQTLVETARPFLPPDLSDAQVSGLLTIDTIIRGLQTEMISFNSKIAGTQLGASGKILGGKEIGPLGFEVSNKGEFDPKLTHATIDKGSLRLDEAVFASWRASVDGVNTPTPNVDLNFGPFRIDLGETMRLARPFLPEDIKANFAHGANNSRPEFKIEILKFSGVVPNGPNVILLSNMTLSLPEFELAAGGPNVAEVIEIKGSGFKLDAPRLAAELVDSFPSAAALDVGLALESVNIEGPASILLQDMNISKLHLEIADLKKSETNSIGYSLRATVKESLKIGEVRALNLAEAAGISQTLDISLRLDPGGAAQVDLGDVGFAAKDISVKVGEGVEALSVELSSKGKNPGLHFSLSESAFSGPLPLGPLPNGPNPVKIKKLNAGMAGLRLMAAQNKVSLDSAELSLRDLATELRDSFPTGAKLALGVALENLHFVGAAETGTSAAITTEIESLTIDAPTITATNLRADKAAAFGYAAELRMAENLKIKGVKALETLTIGELTQSLKAACVLRGNVPITLGLEELKVDGQDLSYAGQGEGAAGLSASTDLHIKAAADSITVKELSPPLVDVKGFSLNAEVGDLLNAAMEADVEDSAEKNARTKGTVNLDLGEIARVVASLLPKGMELSGKTAVAWDIDARRPTDDEIAILQEGAAEPLKLRRASAFINKIMASVSLDKMRIAAPVGAGESAGLIRVENISTDEPFVFRATDGIKSAGASGQLSAKGIKVEGAALPELPSMNFSLDFALSQENLAGFSLAQNFNLEPFGLKEKASVEIFGIDKLLKRGLTTPLALWTEVLGGSVEASVGLGSNESVDPAAISRPLTFQGASLDGGIEGHLKAKLAPQDEASMELGLKSKGMNLNLDKIAEIKNFQSALSLDKRYGLGRKDNLLSDSKNTIRKRQFLSTEVLAPQGDGAPFIAEAQSSFLSMGGGGSIRGKVAAKPSLSFASAKIETGPVPPFPMDLSNYALDIRLAEGLPVLDSFRIDVLGGTAMGALGVFRVGDEFFFSLNSAFSGINMKELAPGLVQDVPDEEAEIGGQMALTTPISTSLSKVLETMSLNLKITKIGSRVLERALFGLDPTESNEAIIAQRKLVKKGSPLWFEAGIKHGKLRTDGEVQALGIKIRFPQLLGGVNVGSLGGMDELEDKLAGLAPMLDILEKLSAATILVDEDGGVEFVH